MSTNETKLITAHRSQVESKHFVGLFDLSDRRLLESLNRLHQPGNFLKTHPLRI